jgi:hypothetical protein
MGGSLTQRDRLHSASVSSSSNLRWEPFIAGLPHGLHSYPECQVKASVVRAMCDDLGKFELSPALPELIRQLAIEPPPVASWVPEAQARALYLAYADAAGMGDEELVRFSREGSLRLISSPMYKAMWFDAPEQLGKYAQSRWAAFRRGTSVELVEQGKRTAKFTLRIPLPLAPLLLVRIHLAGFEAAMIASGADLSRSEVLERRQDETLFSLHW